MNDLEIVEAVRHVLTGEPEIMEVAPLFLLPSQARHGSCKGRIVPVLLRYAHVAHDQDGGTVYVRGHGVPFEIYPPEWYGRLAPACASIGPGLDDEGREGTVLLAQRIGADVPLDALLAVCADFGADTVTSAEPVYGLPSFRLSVRFPRAQGGA